MLSIKRETVSRLYPKQTDEAKLRWSRQKHNGVGWADAMEQACCGSRGRDLSLPYPPLHGGMLLRINPIEHSTVPHNKRQQLQLQSDDLYAGLESQCPEAGVSMCIEASVSDHRPYGGLTCAARFCAALLLVLNSLLPYPFRPSPLPSPPSLSALLLITAIISPLEGSFGEAGLDCCMLSEWSRGGVAELLCGKSGSRRTTECLVIGHGDSN